MLSGRVVVITGSTSGIGLGTARAALEAGARVFLHGPDAAALEAASTALGGVAGIAVDLVLPRAGRDIVAGALAAYGRIDALVNNAGIFPRQTLEQTEAAFVDHMFTVNARAPLLVAQAVVEAFRAQGEGGAIVNIGSVNAYGGAANLVAYSMSKGALMTMTRNLAHQLAGELIRVNQLNLGWVLTEAEKRVQRESGQPDDWHVELPRAVAPTGALLTPEQVARHVLFWVDPASAPVTGQVYEVTQVAFLGRP